MKKTFAEMALELKNGMGNEEFYTLCMEFLRTELECDRMIGLYYMYFYDGSCLLFTEGLDNSLSVEIYQSVIFEES